MAFGVNSLGACDEEDGSAAPCARLLVPQRAPALPSPPHNLRVPRGREQLTSSQPPRAGLAAAWGLGKVTEPILLPPLKRNGKEEPILK